MTEWEEYRQRHGERIGNPDVSLVNAIMDNTIIRQRWKRELPGPQHEFDGDVTLWWTPLSQRLWPKCSFYNQTSPQSSTSPLYKHFGKRAYDKTYIDENGMTQTLEIPLELTSLEKTPDYKYARYDKPIIPFGKRDVILNFEEKNNW